jgi:hypothetical protein
MLIIDPPATAGGPDIYPSEILTFEQRSGMMRWLRAGGGRL